MLTSQGDSLIPRVTPSAQLTVVGGGQEYLRLLVKPSHLCLLIFSAKGLIDLIVPPFGTKNPKKVKSNSEL